MIEGDIAVSPSSSSSSSSSDSIRDSVFNNRRFPFFLFQKHFIANNTDICRTWDYGKVPYTFDPSISREGEFENQK